MLFLLVLAFLAIPSFAESKAELSGFGSIGAVYLDSSDIYQYRLDGSQFNGAAEGEIDFSTTSVLGLQLDYAVNDKLDFVYQAIYRNQEDMDLDSISNLAFLRYSPNPGWSLRLGRTNFDIYLLSEYRDVGFAYPWAHVPSETYGTITYHFIDGMDITYTKQFNGLTLATKAFAGSNETTFKGRTDTPKQTVGLDRIYGLSFDLVSNSWAVDLKYTQVEVGRGTSVELVNGINALATAVPTFDFIWPGAAEFSKKLLLKGVGVKYLSLSGHYDYRDWRVMTEVSALDSSSILIPLLKSGYLSVIYYRGSHSLYGTYSQIETDPFDVSSLNIDAPALNSIPGGAQLLVGVTEILTNIASNQNTSSLGWRWDFKDNMSLKIQLDRVRVSEKGSSIVLRSFAHQGSLKDQFNVLFANVSFTF